MRLVNLILVAVATLFVVGGNLQERRRLSRLRNVPVAQARALYEAAQVRRERVMLVVTAVLAIAAVVSVVSLAGASR
jgi:hypothetical protein